MIQRKLYSVWVLFSIALWFLVFIIPQLLCTLSKSGHKLALRLNYAWAYCFFKLSFIPVEKIWHFTPDKNQQYILCANHFSYLDIPALGLFPQPFKFVGKSELAKIPVFGMMYSRLHITVKRSSYRSRANSLLKARTAAQEGFNLGFFPEGGIRLKEYPMMVPFLDGAFRIAAENNVPIVPIIFPDNYNILRDDEIFSMRRRKCRMIYKQPVLPTGETEEDIRKLKDEVFRVIQNQLDQLNS